MTLFEIITGMVGESYVRCYCWARTIEEAETAFAEANPQARLVGIMALFNHDSQPFITDLSDSGFGMPMEAK